MYSIIAIFYASLLLGAIMILSKRREVRTGRPTLLSRLGRGSDHVFHAIFASARRTISYINRHTFIALSHLVAYHVLVRVRNVYVELKHRALANHHGRKIIDAVRGRGEVRTHGASLYLRRISTEAK